jgi:3-keto-L-gulonate-6-phosphate decarboxylase
MVAIDGGITEATVETLVRAGANRLCVGAAIASSADPARAYANIHERAMRGCQPVVG